MEAILEPDGELCVSVLIQNPTCVPVCLSSGDILGQIQPVTVAPEPVSVVALLEGDTPNWQVLVDANSCENSHL